ncbi:LexA family transcriptional regulator [Streptococcus suis]|nr:LexA family transcriptional regulator [Streptococcus suis]NQK17996.1 LexA family transcriptional regulator [Streptococcus suis]
MVRGRGKLTPQEIELMSVISANINRYLTEQNKKQIDLSRGTGIPPSTLTGYVKGTSLPIPGNVQKIADYFGLKKSDIDPRFKSTIPSSSIPNSLVEQISDKVVYLDQELKEPRHSEWISHGERLLNEQKRTSTISENIIDLYDTRKRTVGIVDFSASAGTGVWQDENLGMEVSFYEDDMAEDYDSIGIVMGSSMEPVLKNGDYLFVKVTTDIPNGAISIWQVNGENFVKKFRKNGKPYLESLNPEFDDIELHEDDDIRPLGIVVDVYREN